MSNELKGLRYAKSAMEAGTIAWAWYAFDWKTALLVFLALLTSNLQADWWRRQR